MHSRVAVYLDESGDLGYSRRSSRHLVVVALATAEPHKLVRVVRKTRRKFGHNYDMRSELKFNRSGEPLRSFLLDGVIKANSWFTWCGVDKHRIPTRLQSDKANLWQLLAARAVGELSRRTHTKAVHLFVDRRAHTKVVRNRISQSLALEVGLHHSGWFPPEITVTHMDSSSSEGLQVADHVAGAVFVSLERGDSSFLDRVQERVLWGQLIW